MEGVGILKACTTNVVPNNARITVTTRLSKYSRSVDCIGIHRRQNIQRQPGGFLLGTFLAVALPFGHVLAIDLEFHRKNLAVVGPGLFYQAVLSGRTSQSLQAFLKLRLEVLELKAAAGDNVEVRLEDSQQEFAGRLQTHTQENRPHQGFKSIGQQCLLSPTAGLLFALSEHQELTQFQLAAQLRQV